jgi:hypothetical protein
LPISLALLIATRTQGATVYVTLCVAEWNPCTAVIMISHLPGFVMAFTTTGTAPAGKATN